MVYYDVGSQSHLAPSSPRKSTDLRQFHALLFCAY